MTAGASTSRPSHAFDLVIFAAFGVLAVSRLFPAPNPARIGHVTSPEGGLSVNVFGKVMKLVANGTEDSTYWMARQLGERLQAG